MTELLFREDAYLKSVDAIVQSITERGGIILDKTNFYAAAGGQPGDKGTMQSTAKQSRLPRPFMTKGKTSSMCRQVPVTFQHLEHR